jgi:cytochrome c oxidase assembly protein subunit 15
MRVTHLSPVAFRRLTLIAALAVAFIIVTGGAVRITGSGLGCPDWPTCDNQRVVAPLEYHAMVEFVNRMITGLVSVAVIVAVLGALVRRPRRRDLTWLSLGLVAGVVAQIVLGGLTVLFKLKPGFALLADAVVLHHRAAQPDGARSRPAVSADLRLMGRLVLVAAGLAVLLGTIVTGSGPHGGDPNVERLPFAVPDVARFHGLAVILFIAITLVTLWRLQRAGAPGSLMRAGEALVAVAAAQAAVGYAQYFTGVPVLLVGIHIAGAALVWAAAVRFLLGFSVWPAPDGQAVALGAPNVLARQET